MHKAVTDLIKKLSNATTINTTDITGIDISSLECDSRKVQKDSLFFCIKGATVDGHDFVEQAIKNGASAIIAEHDVAVPDSIVKIIVPDTHRSMEEIVPYFYDYPSKKMRLIGVTGTNGKTTITYIIRSILRKAGYKTGLIGTIKIMVEDEILPIHNTTPDIIDLQHVLYHMQKAGMDYVVMEVSSHALALNRVAGCEYDTAVFTNLTRDHLDFHKTFENYALAKAKLFSSLTAKSNIKQNKTAIINIDDPSSNIMCEHTKCRLFTYAIHKDASLKACNINIHANGMEFSLRGSLTDITLHLNITGMFNVYNVMGAIGAALAENIELRFITAALEKFHSVPGRFELIRAGQDFSVIVDYAHTPDGLENVLNTARQITTKRLITVFGCGGDRDRTKRPIMGKIAAEKSDIVIATSDNPRSEDPEFILSEVENGVIPALHGNFHEKITDRKKAIYRAIELAKAGDIVMIAGKGHENYQILKDKTIHFDDKEIAITAIKSKLAGEL
ncbi:UDP-N-acetylmuramoyl-L-alanyl-D-glutamate--2,6-diaminopimelate ligase [Pectinatus frisingensis]|jgi:UDP-N-acetylmuramyl-tripeptide synthetase|uniref:UDP-N-acetylmuramoyl-L-alanyl-D-glutamate--2, 6-diaminopimelate ligase n=1 Tax=Pectinatus frisingensis TaxID=865 RepID=UPI0015F44F43|nr:UDP-N-acetylmuramoyl-L-alanyl-D-glutamate--2,6-diaminopimelate ligase [Pectinatus frisingensis]